MSDTRRPVLTALRDVKGLPSTRTARAPHSYDPIRQKMELVDVDERTLQPAAKEAVRKARLANGATCRTFGQSLLTHLLKAAYDTPAVRFRVPRLTNRWGGRRANPRR